LKHRQLIILSVGIVTVAIVVFSLFHISNADAIAAASTWARIAPLPSSAHDRHVEVKGSMFTREFVITFTAPPNDVHQWLRASPGTSSAKQSTSGATTIYPITPGGGAQFAEVRVNESSGDVTIRTYWS